jgi:amino-acid N-acetyltransferase
VIAASRRWVALLPRFAYNEVMSRNAVTNEGSEMTQTDARRNGEAAEIGRLRRARTGDVVAMQQIINGFADRDAMLHRSLSQLYENIRDFFVVEEEGKIVGCAGLHVNWRDLAELKSLAVAESAQGRGYGRELIAACLAEAEEIGVSRVFALTYVPDLFVKTGFQVVDRSVLPRKVWTECVYCPKFPDCGEIAVMRGIGGADLQPERDRLPLTLELRPR